MATRSNPGPRNVPLNSRENARADLGRAARGSSAWYSIGIFLFIVLLGVVFFVLASGTLRHRYLNRQPPEGNQSTAPGPVIAH